MFIRIIVRSLHEILISLIHDGSHLDAIGDVVGAWGVPSDVIGALQIRGGRLMHCIEWDASSTPKKRTWLHRLDRRVHLFRGRDLVNSPCKLAFAKRIHLPLQRQCKRSCDHATTRPCDRATMRQMPSIHMLHMRTRTRSRVRRWPGAVFQPATMHPR